MHLESNLTTSTVSLREVKTVKYKGTTKDATCNITVKFLGSDIIQSGSSVSCTINWPMKKDLDKDVTVTVVIGDVLEGKLIVDVLFNLYKPKNKPALKTKTRKASFRGFVE